MHSDISAPIAYINFRCILCDTSYIISLYICAKPLKSYYWAHKHLLQKRPLRSSINREFYYINACDISAPIDYFNFRFILCDTFYIISFHISAKTIKSYFRPYKYLFQIRPVRLSTNRQYYYINEQRHIVYDCTH